MEVPRIYGDSTKFRKALRRRIKSGHELLDYLDGALTTIPPDSEPKGGLADLLSFGAAYDARQKVDRWWRHNHDTLRTYLAGAADEWLPLPSHRSGPQVKGRDLLNAAADDAREQIVRFEELLEMVPTARAVAKGATTRPRFDELHRSGLIKPEAMLNYETRMGKTSKRADIPGAIAAAKELTEAVIKATLECLDISVDKKAEMPVLTKTFRQAIKDLTAPTHPSMESADRFLSHLSNIVTFLAEWRNELGDGHGRRAIPDGLQQRHALLAVDACETFVRFAVLALDDAGRLPGGAIRP